MIKQLWEKYLDALNAADVNGLMEMFIPEGVFDDSFRKLLGYRESRITGRESIGNFFTELFQSHTIRAEHVLQFGQKQFYNIHVDERATFHCVGTMEANDGLIESVEIRSRS